MPNRLLREYTYRGLFILTLLIAVVLVPSVLHAETIYKWVDEHGTVHYGDVPPTAATRSDSMHRDTRAGPRPKKSVSVNHKPPHVTNEKTDQQTLNQKSPDERLVKRCAVYQDKYDYYTSRMRAGYKAQQYTGLEQKRRHYREQLRRSCN